MLNMNRSSSLTGSFILIVMFFASYAVSAFASVRFEHIAINVENPKAVADWYVKYVGLKIIAESKKMIFVGDLDNHCMFELYNKPDVGDSYST